MTDQEYANELDRLVEAYEADEITRYEWKEQVAALRDRRQEECDAAKEQSDAPSD